MIQKCNSCYHSNVCNLKNNYMLLYASLEANLKDKDFQSFSAELDCEFYDKSIDFKPAGEG